MKLELELVWVPARVDMCFEIHFGTCHIHFELALDSHSAFRSRIVAVVVVAVAENIRFVGHMAQNLARTRSLDRTLFSIL